PYHKVLCAASTASLVLRSFRNATTAAPRSSCKVTFATAIAAPTSASRPLHNVVILVAIAVATSASRSEHRTPSIISLYSSQVAHARFGLRKAKRRLRKASIVSRKTTHLNRQD
ncbi:hypothetical protein ACLOJK_006829, partial [Asimina triloba]